MSAGRAEKINSMCTVFAESEVISLSARGASRLDVALGIHKAIVSRSTALLKRTPLRRGLFRGEVALNDCIRALITEDLNRPVVPPDSRAWAPWAPRFTRQRCRHEAIRQLSDTKISHSEEVQRSMFKNLKPVFLVAALIIFFLVSGAFAGTSLT